MAAPLRRDPRRVVFLISAAALVGLAAQSFAGHAHERAADLVLPSILLVLAVWLVWVALWKSQRRDGLQEKSRLAVPRYVVFLIALGGVAVDIALIAAVHQSLATGWPRVIGIALVVAVGLGAIFVLGRVARSRFERPGRTGESEGNA